MWRPSEDRHFLLEVLSTYRCVANDHKPRIGELGKDSSCGCCKLRHVHAAHRSRGIGAMIVGTFLYDQIDPLAPWIAGAIVSLVPWQACGGGREVRCDRMCGRKSYVDLLGLVLEAQDSETPKGAAHTMLMQHAVLCVEHHRLS